MENILRRLIKQETVDTKKYVFFMLMKFHNNLIPVRNKTEYTPLIYIHHTRIHMVYEDEMDGRKYTLTKPEEILNLLQILLNEGKDIFFLYEGDEDKLDKQSILDKIDEALDTKDKKKFLKYSEKLKYYEKRD